MPPSLRSAAIAALLGTCCAWAGSSLADPLELVSADDRGVTLRLTVGGETLTPESDPSSGSQTGRSVLEARGFASTDVPGRVRLPYASTLLALPPRAEARIRVLDSSGEQLRTGLRLAIGTRPGFRADPGALGAIPVREAVTPILDGAWPASPVELGAPFTMRRQRVVSVALYPYRYDEGSGRLWTRATMLVRVDFVGARPAEAAPARDDRGWEGVLREGVLNYEQGRGFRLPSPLSHALAPGASLFARSAGKANAQAFAFDESQPEVRVLCDTTALYAFDYATLSANGFPSGVPIAEVSVHRHEFLEGTAPPDPSYATLELPCEVDDRNSNRVFDANDRVMCYVQSWADRAGASVPQRVWGDAEAAFVTRKPGGGARLRVRDGWRGQTGLTPLVSYPYTQHWERNLSYLLAPRDTLQDQFHWTAITLYYDRPDTIAIEINHLDASRPVTVAVTLDGRKESPHIDWIDVRPASGPFTSVADSVSWFGLASRTFTATLPGTAIGEGGGNRLRIYGKSSSAPPNNVNNNSDPTGLNFCDVTYWRAYRGIKSYLRASSGDADGEYQVHATGFQAVSSFDSVRAYDVTDPIDPVRLSIDPSRIQLAGGELSADFQDSTAASSPKSYVVTSAARRPTASKYARVTRYGLSQVTAGDYLLIVPEAFLPTIQPLVDLRTAQGLRVVVSPLEAIDDEFNGGRRSSSAIKRYVKRCADAFDARFVLLLGDGSEDPQNFLQTSSVDWIPVQKLRGPVFFGLGYEIVPSDPWYVIFGNADPNSAAPVVPDLFLGRLPVSSFTEAQDVIAKIVAYEQITPDQTWRSRLLLSADDAYSGDSFFGGGGGPAPYCHVPGEAVFQAIEESVASVIASPDSAGLTGLTLQRFYMSEYLRNEPYIYPGANGDTCRPSRDDTMARTHANVTPQLLSALNDGRLWWNYQGHANEFVLAHEDLYVNRGSTDDKDYLTNDGKPFLFSAFSCHANAFARTGDLEGGRGPCIGEDLIRLAGKGAIASWASSGYEILPNSGNNHINVELARALFFRPPTDSYLGEVGARVVLGEGIVLALARYVPRPSISFYERGIALTYHLFGDPATRLSIGKAEALVTANSFPVTDATPVRLGTLGDTLRLDAELVSNVRISQLVLEHHDGAVTDTIPMSDYTLTPAFPDTVAGGAGGRRFHLTYHTTLPARTVSYTFRTVDRNAVPGSFEALFQFYTQLRAEGAPIADNDPVSPTAKLSMLVLSPKPLVPASDLALTVNGASQVFTAAAANGDLSGREWILSWTHPSYAIDQYVVRLQPVAGTEQLHTFRVISGVDALQLQDVVNFPNPFEELRGTLFSFFLLSSAPTDVRVRVYTVGGRLIYERVERGLQPGYHQLPWDGRDAEGEPLANGTYLYRMVASTGSAKSEFTGRMVKLRNPRHGEDTSTTPP